MKIPTIHGRPVFPWNPVKGCTEVSDGCRNCLAKVVSRRLKGKGLAEYATGFEPCLVEDRLDDPLKRIRPCCYRTADMSDLFHEAFPLDYVQNVVKIMRHAPQHLFLVTTKRAQRLKELASELEWPENLWLGVSVENREHVSRIEDLRMVPAARRFVSFEPLIGPIGEIDLSGMDWVVVGGELGRYARHMDVSWVRTIRDCAIKQGKPFCFTTWDQSQKNVYGQMVDGQAWSQTPA